MARLKPQRLKELAKYTKEEIIEAIGRSFHADYIFDDLLSDLNNMRLQKALNAEREADRNHTEKLKALLAWRTEMAVKYGDGTSVKLSALPPEEVKRGAKIEREYLAANEAVEKLEKRARKLMGVAHDV